MRHKKYAKSNELETWIYYARTVNFENRKYQFAVKGDMDTPYDAVQEVIWALQEWNVNRFQLITALESGQVIAPERYLRRAKINRTKKKEE